jgi:hypothetical protein
MRKIIFAVTTIVAVLSVNTASACCGYGCCDCSCVALKLEKMAPKLAKKVRGSLESFSVDTASTKNTNATWKCQMQAQIATCAKQ